MTGRPTEISLYDIDSPVGTLTAAEHDGRLCVLAFPGHRDAKEERLKKRFGPVSLVRTRSGVSREPIDAYFNGDLDALESIRVHLVGTPFQKEVWEELRRIKRGTTISYGELARRIGRPTHFRAVANANGLNPVAIVVPCHRVIGQDGTLTGYGGGLERKEWLLRHEGAWPAGLL